MESTLGTGQKTLRGTVPADRAAAYQASLADGAPYTRPPGPAHMRSATSACTMTTPRPIDGKVASRCSTTGTATLYGRLAAMTVGRSMPPGPIRSASAAHDRRPGRRGPGRDRRSSWAVRRPAPGRSRPRRPARRPARRPRPGPASASLVPDLPQGSRHRPRTARRARRSAAPCPARRRNSARASSSAARRAGPRSRGCPPPRASGRPRREGGLEGRHQRKTRWPVACSWAQKSASSMPFSAAR